VELRGRVAVLSPHLDDAVFSLGAALARAARRGAAVTVVTVFANDPESAAPPEPWDAASGFASAADAARGRRDEDAAACRLIGARPVWLPLADEDHGGAEDDEVLAAVQRAVAGADVALVPGFPLEHGDHLRLARIVHDRLPVARTGFYAEQPYAVWRTAAPSAAEGWRPVTCGWRDRLRKLRASAAYRSQLRVLGRRTPLALFRYDVRYGELVRWAEPGDPAPAPFAPPPRPS
jgi:LmbE family N-acetylglucosaminyl deacetylase